VELHRVRADVDDREALAVPTEQRLEPAPVVRVDVAVEAELVDGCQHGIRILGFDGDRPCGPIVDGDVAELGHAAVRVVSDAPLVDADSADGPAGPDHLLEEPVERVDLPRRPRQRHA
jgi:hypothetical protein